jgi:hypothetical protein
MEGLPGITLQTLVYLRRIVAIVGTCVLISCSPSDQRAGQWNPDTRLLTELAQTNPELAGFVRDVKMFYQDLHDKRWAATYKQRNEAFRSDFPEQLYLRIADSDGKSWSLMDYGVLSIQTHDSNRVVLVCRFVEGLRPHTTYNSVTWKNDGGHWYCDCAGPVRLSIFFSSRGQ